MKAMVIEKFGGTEQLHMKEVPTPTPADNEVLIQVNYAAVNPVDWKIREGALEGAFPHKFPLILGWDCSGVVKAVGKNVRNIKPGDEVFAYCRKPQVQWGTYAEYVCYDANNVAIKPRNINFAEAAAIPLACLTAWQALFDSAKLQKGQTVLIHAGAGGVGGFAIQLAHNAGAKVITTASEINHPYVKKLGADYAVDYHKENFADRVRQIAPQGIDVVFDTMGGQTLRDSIGLLRSGGCVVSIIERNIQSQKLPPNIRASYLFVQPDGKQLTQIASMISEGRLRAPQIEEMPLKEAAQAQEKSQSGHTRGKTVLKVSS